MCTIPQLHPHANHMRHERPQHYEGHHLEEDAQHHEDDVDDDQHQSVEELIGILLNLDYELVIVQVEEH